MSLSSYPRVEVYDLSFAWVERLTNTSLHRQMTQKTGYESIPKTSKTETMKSHFKFLIIAQKRENSKRRKKKRFETFFFFVIFASSFDKDLNFNDSQLEHMLIIIKLYITKSVPAESESV